MDVLQMKHPQNFPLNKAIVYAKSYLLWRIFFIYSV